MLKEQKGKKCLIKIEHEPLILKADTMIDTAAGWLGIAECEDKHSVTIEDIIEWT